MMNEKVTHTKYGKGKIVEAKDNYVKIAFTQIENNKMFQYPEAFEGFLVFENEQLQQNVMNEINLLNAKKIEEQNRKLLEYQKLEEERDLEQRELLKKRRKTPKAKVIKN